MKIDKPLSTARLSLFLWIGFFLWMGSVCLLSSLSSQTLSAAPKLFEGADKVAHFALFFIGALLLTPALRLTFPIRWAFIIAGSLLLLGGFGFADEIRQLQTPGRSGADVGDWLADFAGTLAGTLTVYFALRKRYVSSPQVSVTAKDDRDSAPTTGD